MRGRPRSVAAVAACVVACVVVRGTRAGEPSLEERIDALVQSLGAPDPNVRARAAKDVRTLGADAVPILLTRIPRDAGSKRWEGVVDAIGDLGVETAIAEIQSTRSEWSAKGWKRAATAPKVKVEKPPPRSGRGRAAPKEEGDAPEGERIVDLLLERLRTHRAPAVRRTAALEAGALWDASYVPPWLARPVGKKLPEDVALADVPAREDGGVGGEHGNRLALDVAHDGKFSTLVAGDVARVVEIGPKRRKVTVFRRLGRWLAAPAATLTGEIDGTSVQFLDADQDGAFDGDADLVRFDSGAFRRVGADENAAWTAAGIVVWRLKATDEGVAIEFESEPEPAWRTPAQAAEMGELNRWRQGVGLAPQRIDRARSDACRLHHEYWAANGFSGHDQAKGAPAHTSAGAEAGRRSSVGTSPDGARFARDIWWTILHRNSCVGDADVGVGTWAGPQGSLLWGSRIDASPRAFPLLVPGPGMTGVPVACEPEIPVPDKDPQYYATQRGAPVCVTWSRLGGAFAGLKDLKLELFEQRPPEDGASEDGATGDGPRGETTSEKGFGELLRGTLWSKEHRYKEDFAAGFPEESAIFCAAAPLSGDTVHVARFRATGKDGPVEIVWQFRTE